MPKILIISPSDKEFWIEVSIVHPSVKSKGRLLYLREQHINYVYFYMEKPQAIFFFLLLL